MSAPPSAVALRRAGAALIEAADDLEAERQRVDALLLDRAARPRPLETVGELFERACEAIGARIDDVRGDRKFRRLALQRKVLARTLRLADVSLPEIADAMHRTHETVLHNLRDLPQRLELDARAAARRLGIEVGGVWRPPTFVIVPPRLAHARWSPRALPRHRNAPRAGVLLAAARLRRV